MLKHNKEKSNIFPGKKVSIVWEANDKLAVKEVDTKILPSSTEEDDEEFILSDDEYELDEANTESLQVEPTEVEEKVKGLNISHWYSFTASMHGLWFQVQNYLNTKYTQIQTHKSSCGPDMSAM